MKEINIEKKLSHPSNPININSPADRFIEEFDSFEYSKKSYEGFTLAMKYIIKYQHKKSEFLKRYYKMLGFNPNSINKYSDLEKIPFVFVNNFKERNLTTLKPWEIVLELKSSQTSGKSSKISLDLPSLIRVRRMSFKIFNALRCVDLNNIYHYICFTYDPLVANDVGTAWTDKLLTSFTKSGGSIYYAFKWNESKGEFYFDIEGCINTLKEYEEKKVPVRLIGFPAFALKTTEEYKKKFGRYPVLNPLSFVITGGGWKTLENEAIDKKIYRRILADNLSIPVENVRDLYGMVEHGVAYVDCELGNFHIPIYGKVIARDPLSFKNLGYNKKGLLQFITPYLSSYPSFSLLSSDWGIIREGCKCKIKGPVLEIIGRAGIRKLKGCAITASQMLK